MSEDEGRKILAALTRLRRERDGHAHQHDTNGDRYRCPAPGCWWTGTGAQATDTTTIPNRRDR